MKKIIYFYLPILFWLTLMFILSSITVNWNIKSMHFQLDKVVHFVEYGILGILLARALYYVNAYQDLKRAILLTFGIALFIAGIDEFHQIYFPRRNASFYDFGADVLGIVGSQLLFWYYIQFKKIPE